MKLSSLSALVLIGFASLASTGCAVLTKGRKQEVVIQSAPVGAVTKINGFEVGKTPYRVKLKRKDIFRVDFGKPGFTPASALLLPSTSDYDERYLRWGIDYDTGAAIDLIPAELFVEMKPAMGDIVKADRFEEMSAQIARADALLASGDITAEDHKYLVDQIIATYRRTY